MAAEGDGGALGPAGTGTGFGCRKLLQSCVRRRAHWDRCVRHGAVNLGNRSRTAKMVKIRLRRMGTRNRPFYRVVVSDTRKVPTSSAIEEVGHYDPTKGMDSCKLDLERVRHWVDNGALMSPTVKKLVRHQEKSVA